MNQENPGQKPRVFLCDVSLKLAGNIDPLTGFSANLPEMDEWALQAKELFKSKQFVDLKAFALAVKVNFLDYAKAGDLSLATFAEILVSLNETAVVLEAAAEFSEVKLLVDWLVGDSVAQAKIRIRAASDLMSLQNLAAELEAKKEWEESAFVEFVCAKLSVKELEIQVLNQPPRLRRFHLV